MKKIAILFLMLLLILPGCSKKAEPTVSQTPPPPSESNKEEEKNDAEPEKEEANNDKDSDFALADAAKGRFTNLEITFDDPLERVFRVLGDPDEISSWQGSELYIYNNLGIYIDPYDELVTGLTAGTGYETYGVTIGMSADLVKSILGEPDFEGISSESGAKALEYKAGDYLVEFVVNQESGKTVGVTLYSYMN